MIFTLVSLIFSSHRHGKCHLSLNYVHVVSATEVVTFTYVSTYVRTAIGSCDNEYGTLLNGNHSGGLGSCLVKVPGLFCGSCMLENETALCQKYGL